MLSLDRVLSVAMATGRVALGAGNVTLCGGASARVLQGDDQLLGFKGGGWSKSRGRGV
jgi:hypothetical protein